MGFETRGRTMKSTTETPKSEINATRVGVSNSNNRFVLEIYVDQPLVACPKCSAEIYPSDFKKQLEGLREEQIRSPMALRSYDRHCPKCYTFLDVRIHL